MDNFLFSAEYIVKQINYLVPDGYNVFPVIYKYFNESLNETEKCIRATRCGAEKGFDYLITWHYAIFLYTLSRVIWLKTAKHDEAVRIFQLNKIINGIDLFYETAMPDFFAFGHTVGIVLSKSTYSNYCVFHQGCTVGRQDNKYPVLESGIVMFPGAMVIGNSCIKENTVIAPGVKLINTSTPGNCIVFEGKGNNFIYKELTSYYVDKYFIRNER